MTKETKTTVREYDKEGKLIRETVTEIKESKPDSITLDGNEWWKQALTCTDKTTPTPFTTDAITVTCQNNT